MTTPQYTTAEQIRATLRQAADAKARATATDVDQGVIDRWAERRIEAAQRQGRLMTTQQHADWRARRSFDVGDYALYVGPTRQENVGDVTYTRRHGQRGRIVDVQRAQVKSGPAPRIITFQPLSAGDEDVIMQLVVREGTPGYLDLERSPPVS